MKRRTSSLACAARAQLSNYTILVLAACVFNIQMMLDPGAEYLSGLVLQKWSIPGLFGHMWLHMTPVHLLGNLLILWVFGCYVCPKLGAWVYAFGYLTAGIAAAVVHMACDGRPMIGASGAIMGVFGMAVVICFRQLGRLGPWLVLVWFLATLGAGLVGGFPAAYMAHIGGFLSGMILAICFLICGIADSQYTDPALMALIRPQSHKVGLDSATLAGGYSFKA